jgi:vesicle-fusing ATPase
MDAIARKRGTMTADTTGVRDSVVNQLLAKMDGVKQASNVLVVGLTNRPELLDPALLRPGRLEVHLRIELPDLLGRRDILRIHTRRMRDAGALSAEAVAMVEDVTEVGLAARSEYFSGAEIAGLVRSAASFALARTVENDQDGGVVGVSDLEEALQEVIPALGKQDEVLKLRYPLGISPCSSSMKRIMRDLERFTAPVRSKAPRLQSLLLVGAGGNGGTGATALAAWAAAETSVKGDADFVRFITALDLLAGEGGGGDEARAHQLIQRFQEAREMSHSLLVLDDVDQLCAGSGPNGYSSIMIATLRALLRVPSATSAAKASGLSESKQKGRGKTLHIIAATSRSDAACMTLYELFDETIGK